MTTTTTARHETTVRFLAALAGTAQRGELLELRYRLEDGQRMGQVFDRPDRVRGLATRAIFLGRRTDVYVGCAPRTRRHGGRDAVDRAFVLWADCDGEGGVAAVAAFEPAPAIGIALGRRARQVRAGAGDRDPLRQRSELPRLLAARRAARVRRGRAREPAPRARAPRRPRGGGRSANSA